MCPLWPQDHTANLDPSECCAILQEAPVGVFKSTPEGKFVAVNPAQARMYGYSSPEEMLDSVSDIAEQLYADPADRDKFLQAGMDEYIFKPVDREELLRILQKARELK